jgi:diguanylate cyclase (GGDEF)-like protein
VGTESTWRPGTAQATSDSYVDVTDSHDSVYARQLQRGRKTRFEPPLEDAYIAAHLDRARLRVRVWFTLTSAIGALSTMAEAHRTGFTSAGTLLHAALLLPCDVALVWICWSSVYKRTYSWAAPYLVTVLGAIAAVSIASGIAEGRGTELSALTTTVVAISFFSGLMFRQALLPTAVTLLSFLTTSFIIGAAPAETTESIVVLALTAGISLLVGRDIDCSYRKSFLESAIIRELLARDGLSGLMNRRSFDDHLLKVWQQALHDRCTVAILMIDIDHFKRYNDSHGHLVGDATLRSVARAIQGVSRGPLDLAARYGGEEFAVILYGRTTADLADSAERLCQAVRNIRIGVLNSASRTSGPHVTVSVGVGIAEPRHGRSPQGAIQLADEALYEAKRSGRDRVVLKDTQEYGLLNTGTFGVMRQ